MEVKIKIDNPMLADYLKYLFHPTSDRLLKVNSEHGMGKLLIAHCRISQRQVDNNINDENVFTLKLPMCQATQGLEYKFLFYSKMDIEQLNLALRSFFDLDFAGYYRRGENMEFSKKDIIEAFIISRGLISIDCFDTLSKQIYRKQATNRKAIMSKLSRKAHYINESIDDSGLMKAKK